MDEQNQTTSEGADANSAAPADSGVETTAASPSSGDASAAPLSASATDTSATPGAPAAEGDAAPASESAIETVSATNGVIPAGAVLISAAFTTDDSPHSEPETPALSAEVPHPAHGLLDELHELMAKVRHFEAQGILHVFMADAQKLIARVREVL